MDEIVSVVQTFIDTYGNLMACLLYTSDAADE